MTEQSALRALYLDGHSCLRVFQDGPALRIRRENSADRLFPLRHLMQVVVSGPVEWSTNALLACAEASVPVVFLRANGSLRARVLGTLTADPLLDLDLTLETFLEQPEGPERYHAWVSAKSQQARQEFLRIAGWRNLPAELKTVRQLIEQHARLHVRASELRKFDRQVYSLLTINVDKLLRKYGLDPDRPGLAVEGFNIVRDFTNILIWTLQKEKMRYLKHLHNRARRKGDALARLNWLQAVGFVEQNIGNIAEEIRKTYRQFHTCLMESIRSHGNQ